MSKENAFIKGAALVVLSALFVKVLGIVYKIPLSYILSDEGMGYFNSAYTIFSFFYIIAGAGVPKAISILISSSENGREKCNHIYASAIKFFGILGFLSTLVFLLLAYPLSCFFKSQGSLLSMISIAPSVFFVAQSSVVRGYFTGKFRFSECAISELIASLGKLVFGLIFAFIGIKYTQNMTYISALTIFGTSVGAFLSWLYLLLKKKDERVLKNLLTPSISSFWLKKILRISLPLTLSAFISSFSGVLDLGIFMRTLWTDGYTEFQASVLYGNYSTMVIPMLTSVSAVISPVLLMIIPIISRDREILKSKETLSFIIKGLTMISSYFFIVFLFESRELLSLLFENTSAILAAPSLTLMSFGIYFMCLLSIINTVLEGAGDVKTPLYSLIIGASIKSLLTVILLKNDVLGLLGASVALALSYLVSIIISSKSLRKNVHSKKLNIYKCSLKTLLISVLSYLFVSFILQFINVNIFILRIVIFSLSFLFFNYLFTFNMEEKKKLWLKLTKK